MSPAEGSKILPMEIEDGMSKFDLEFEVIEEEQALSLKIRYAKDLFEAKTIQRMLGRLERLLEGIVTDPERKVSELPLLTVEEEQLLGEWARTDEAYPEEKSLVDLFEEQVERTPEAVALVCGRTRLTYRELHARAAQVSERLQKLDVGSETLVGICLERSWEMVAGILGTLRAGAAYVPMDPVYPRERLAFMLEDARVRVLLTQQKLSGSLPKSGANTLLIEDIKWAAEATPSKSACPKAQDLAYVIYTSGSTGYPKGVAVPHRGGMADLARRPPG